jgi:hypothetical protein
LPAISTECYRRDGRNVAERIARVIVEAALSGDIAAARLVVEVEEDFDPVLDFGRGRGRGRMR